MRRRLLTGCRPSEIRCLRWSEVKSDRLALNDANTGPTHVLLGGAALELLEGLAEPVRGERVFPGKNGDEPLTKDELYSFWIKARDAAETVADARIHDIRPCARFARCLYRECLLGRRRASTTNRNVLLHYTTLSQASERDAMAVRTKLG